MYFENWRAKCNFNQCPNGKGVTRSFKWNSSSHCEDNWTAKCAIEGMSVSVTKRTINYSLRANCQNVILKILLSLTSSFP